MACIFDLKKKFLCNRKLVKIVLCGGPAYSLGIVKMEAFDDSHFMPQAVRVGLTDHTGSIISSMECIFDLKISFYVTGNSHCYSLGTWWYGENGSV